MPGYEFGREQVDGGAAYFQFVTTASGSTWPT